MVVNVALVADICGRLDGVLCIGLQPLCHPVIEPVLGGCNVSAGLFLYQNISYFVCHFFSGFAIDRTLDLSSGIVVAICVTTFPSPVGTFANGTFVICIFSAHETHPFTVLFQSSD